MIRLLYISTARQPLSDHDLDGILRTSRRNNAAVEVTGLLIVGGRRFLQALEGPDDAVLATFARIRRDPRHFAIAELMRGPIEERAFGRWSMGTRRGGDADDALTAATAVEALIAPIEDATLRAYFTGFADLNLAA